MRRHAYLILVHKNFGQFRKLLSLLDDPRNDIFVHVDGKASFNPDKWKNACSFSRLVFIEPRKKVYWGGVNSMRCELALLKEAVAYGPYSYYHLLSGMDLPLKDQDTVHAFFEKHDGKEFIDFWEMDGDIYERVRYYTLFPEGERNFLSHFVNGLFKDIQKAAGRGINKDVDFHFSSVWFSITDPLARYIISKEDWLEKVFSHTSNCDELFLATVVWNSPFRQNLYCCEVAKNHAVNMSNMRFIDWSRGSSCRHPWTFRLEDWNLLMSVPHFWARKFDEGVDSDIIDKIYYHLAGRRVRRLFLMAAYDRKGEVGPALEAYVRELSVYGDVIVVMDNAAAAGEQDKLRPYVLYCGAERHGEYDFGSYKRAYAWAREHLSLRDYDVLYLVNDSVYGPLRSLGSCLERMESMGTGASGMVLNPHHRRPHLQSWFIGLRKEVFLSEWFSRFLEDVVPQESKEAVCMKYETGLTELLASHSVTFDALFRFKGKSFYNRVKASWKVGAPFIKKSAFTRHNGCLGRQVGYVLEHAGNPSVAAAVREDADRLYGKDYVGRLLGGSGPDMILRYISYLRGKILHGRK